MSAQLLREHSFRLQDGTHMRKESSPELRREIAANINPFNKVTRNDGSDMTLNIFERSSEKEEGTGNRKQEGDD